MTRSEEATEQESHAEDVENEHQEDDGEEEIDDDNASNWKQAKYLERVR